MHVPNAGVARAAFKRCALDVRSRPLSTCPKKKMSSDGIASSAAPKHGFEMSWRVRCVFLYAMSQIGGKTPRQRRDRRSLRRPAEVCQSDPRTFPFESVKAGLTAILRAREFRAREGQRALRVASVRVRGPEDPPPPLDHVLHDGLGF